MNRNELIEPYCPTRIYINQYAEYNGQTSSKCCVRASKEVGRIYPSSSSQSPIRLFSPKVIRDHPLPIPQRFHNSNVELPHPRSSLDGYNQ